MSICVQSILRQQISLGQQKTDTFLKKKALRNQRTNENLYNSTTVDKTRVQATKLLRLFSITLKIGHNLTSGGKKIY